MAFAWASSRAAPLKALKAATRCGQGDSGATAAVPDAAAAAAPTAGPAGVRGEGLAAVPGSRAVQLVRLRKSRAEMGLLSVTPHDDDGGDDDDDGGGKGGATDGDSGTATADPGAFAATGCERAAEVDCASPTLPSRNGDSAAAAAAAAAATTAAAAVEASGCGLVEGLSAIGSCCSA